MCKNERKEKFKFCMKKKRNGRSDLLKSFGENKKDITNISCQKGR